ncbi:Serine/threonine-protein kinase Chk2, partial [Geodia barretti]
DALPPVCSLSLCGDVSLSLSLLCLHRSSGNTTPSPNYWEGMFGLLTHVVLSLSSLLSLPLFSISPSLSTSFSVTRGACGEVKLVFEKETCKKYAVKIISKKAFSVGPKLNRAAIEEVKILKELHHPCIIQIEDVFDGPDALYIVLELVEGGELFDRVVSVGKFSESVGKFLFYQILGAVNYLHERNITHRDLKPENILLATDEQETLIKVTDFGLSKFVGEASLMRTLCGTPSYLAPEILESAGLGGYSKAVDCWSLGVILYIMLGGYPPFSDEIKEYTLQEQICQAKYSFSPEYWKDVSSDAIDLIRKLLTLNPKERISMADALRHPWLKDDDVISRARQLMESSPTTPTMPPPPPPPKLSRKRGAPSSEDDPSADGSPCPLAKRVSVETPSPTSENPPDTPLISRSDRSPPISKRTRASTGSATTTSPSSPTTTNNS